MPATRRMREIGIAGGAGLRPCASWRRHRRGSEVFVGVGFNDLTARPDRIAASLRARAICLFSQADAGATATESVGLHLPGRAAPNTPSIHCLHPRGRMSAHDKRSSFYAYRSAFSNHAIYRARYAPCRVAKARPNTEPAPPRRKQRNGSRPAGQDASLTQNVNKSKGPTKAGLPIRSSGRPEDSALFVLCGLLFPRRRPSRPLGVLPRSALDGDLGVRRR